MTDYCSKDQNGMLPLQQANKLINSLVKPITEAESININFAYQRVLHTVPIAPNNIPFFKNSAMDGYAINSYDLQSEKELRFKLVGSSYAGHPYQGSLGPKQCIRIVTGAEIPEPLDTVVIQEEIQLDSDWVLLPKNITPGQYVRLPGEDIAKNAKLFNGPKLLTSIDIGLLASAGITEVSVNRRLKVAFFSTGDELQSIDQPLAEGKIFDSNRYVLKGLLNKAYISSVDLGVIKDDIKHLTETLIDASRHYDVIISTGGASVGDKDFIKDVLKDLGQVNFLKLAVKPGKPMIFGEISQAYFFGLPGNPVSVIATFQNILEPALALMSGMPSSLKLKIEATATDRFKKTPGRLEFVRGILTQNQSGKFLAQLAGKQESHILTSMSRANCYIILKPDSTGFQPGDLVTVEPFSVEI